MHYASFSWWSGNAFIMMTIVAYGKKLFLLPAFFVFYSRKLDVAAACTKPVTGWKKINLVHISKSNYRSRALWNTIANHLSKYPIVSNKCVCPNKFVGAKKIILPTHTFIYLLFTSKKGHMGSNNFLWRNKPATRLLW